MFYSLYPENWPEIRRQIRSRAGEKCEWCGVANGADGARDLTGRFHSKEWVEVEALPAQWDRLFGKGKFPKYIRIVLTVAHLGVPHPDGKPGNKHDKADCRPENLAALCQRCHLNFDREDHIARAAATRERKQRERDAARGWVQLELLG